MALTAAEKQRRYRARRDQDPAKRAEYLTKRKEKYRKDVQDNKRPSVSSMSARQQRALRKKWRISKRDLRQRQKLLTVQTPPSTPDNHGSPAHVPVCPDKSRCPSRQQMQSLKKASRERQKYKTEAAELRKQLKREQRKTEMYRKRLQREIKRSKTEDTPRTKTKKLLRHASSKTVRRALNFHHVLLEAIKRQKSKHRESLKMVLANQILKKYKFKTFAMQQTGLNSKKKMQRRSVLSHSNRKRIQDFFERDDVSRLLTGQKKTITKQKLKKQRRLLCDNLKNLHLKFQSETTTTISYSTFCRFRPFWVVPPTEKDRDTCLCKICENWTYLAEALHYNGVLSTTDLESLVGQTVCTTENKVCMYSDCMKCKEKIIPMQIKDPNMEVSWRQWQTVREDRVFKNGQKKTVTITKKQEEMGTLADLADKFSQQARLYRKHSYNMKNQFRHYRDLRKNLKSNECFIHIDYSENYVGKMSKEIQSVHFGASQSQITLHTGFFEIGGMNPVCFSGVSDSLEHGPGAVWTFLDPVLEDIRRQNPEVTHLHFYSDGPVTQYRQKYNFFMMSTEVFEKGFSGATWNFHESGHGKGIPDGVGGLLKRTADRMVRHGTDITNAETFVEVLKKECPSVKLCLVRPADIASRDIKLQKTPLKTVPGTMRIHQVQTSYPGTIKYGDVSCLCLQDTCVHQKYQHFSFPQAAPEADKQNENQSNTEDVTRKSENSLKQKKNSGKRTVQRSGKKGKMTKERKNQKTQETSHQNEHESFFTGLINRYQRCKNFSELKAVCESVIFEDLEGKPRYIFRDGFTVDENSVDLCPSDIPSEGILHPVTVVANGDCLPGTGSVFAYGTDCHTMEIRARIVVELVLHKDYYLNDSNLNRGLEEPNKPGETKKAFAMYSDEYTYGDVLTENVIEEVFERECLKITKPRSFMGIWQMCALSSVLQMPIFSAYPHRGSDRLRKDLHRKILPRKQMSTDMAVILWTSTRNDMKPEHWHPNHFVPVLYTEMSQEKCTETTVKRNLISMSGETGAGMEDVDGDVNDGERAGVNEIVVGEMEKVDGVMMHDGERAEVNEIVVGEMQKVDGDVNDGERAGVNEIVAGEMEKVDGDVNDGDLLHGDTVCEKSGVHKIRVGEGEQIEENKLGEQTGLVLNDEIMDVNDYLEKYVMVVYDGVLYPGKVLEVGFSDLYVECMHRVGRKNENCFFWPRKIKDKCWYALEDVLAIIPPPKQKHDTGSSHFMVDTAIWLMLEGRNNKQ